MNKELKIFEMSDDELKSLYTDNSTDFLGTSKSQNVKRDIANLSHNELVRRSNNQFSEKSTLLTYAVLGLSVIAVIFASVDYIGDKKWQTEQINQLELINKNLDAQNEAIKKQKALLSNELKSITKKINSIQTISKKKGRKIITLPNTVYKT